MSDHDERIADLRARVEANPSEVMRGFVAFTFHDIAFLLSALDAVIVERDDAREERDARPEITAAQAAGWLTERFDADGPSSNWNAVVLAMRAHAAKAGGAG